MVSHFNKRQQANLSLLILILILILILNPGVYAHSNSETGIDPGCDTIRIPKGIYFIGISKTITLEKDTFYLAKTMSQQKSDVFYDSVYLKFSRHKFGKFIYSLSFIHTRNNILPDTVHQLKGELLFEKYKGRIIRNITIKILDPFGPTIVDTAGITHTFLGRAGNAIHINTQTKVIRKDLLFKKGQPLDPNTMAENERILRDLASIDDARILVEEVLPGSDSVDILVITKDVFSIGFALPSTSLSEVRLRLYDANFMGMDHFFSNTFSMEPARMPFFRWNSISYAIHNIGGIFFDWALDYSQDDIRNQRFLTTFSRGFYSNKTKYAGGIGFEYNKRVDIIQDTIRQISFYNVETGWFGRSFLLPGKGPLSRFVIGTSYTDRNFLVRPVVTPDTNKFFYNSELFLASLSYSRNNYYIADYIRDFGRTENIPYGHLIQVTLGPEINEFYNRLYMGFTFAKGNFIKKIGYLSGSASIGSFFRKNAFEDGVFKLRFQYMTDLLQTHNKKYKYRTYFNMGYTLGFNDRKNNLEQSIIYRDLMIRKYATDTVFSGNRTIYARLSSTLFTPWYFYGFKFGLNASVSAGLVGNQPYSLSKSYLFMGFTVGILIKNDNLVFPRLYIFASVYPFPIPGVPAIHFDFIEDIFFPIRDFNVSSPSILTLSDY